MLYTTYFGKLKKLPKDIIPISICGKVPEWYDGLQYKKLAPKYDFFMKWKENHDNGYYAKCFKDQVLNNLEPSEVVMELKHLCDKSMYANIDIALICYEKPEDFCHRHIVAKWLRAGGYDCKEWSE